MAKRMLIDASHPEETRVVVLKGNSIEEFDYENASRKQLKGNIYLAKVTRVEPSLQAAFVDYGGNRHGFLPFSEIHPDYYRIPVADREALLAAEASEQKRVAREAEESVDTLTEDRDAAAEADPDSEAPGETLADDREGEPENDAAVPAEVLAPEDVTPEDGAPEVEAPRPAVTEDGETGAQVPAFAEAYSERPESEADQESEETETSGAGGESDGLESAAVEDGPDETAENGEDSLEAADSGEGAAESEEKEGSSGRRRGRNNQSSRRGRRQRRPERRSRAGSLSSEALDDEDEAGEEAGVDTLGGDEADEVALSRAKILRGYKIQEVIKRRQVLLVQVTKEERGNKGAALTTYLSLPGRFCVLMPNTARGGGISRKISNLNDRRRLKKIVNDLDIPEGIAVIVRTAGSQRSKAEIRRDYDYLLRLWDEIRETTLSSTAPQLVYEEANLIKRAIRDLYDSETEDVLVEGDEGYKAAKSFMKSLMPSHARKVKQYKEQPPLYYRYRVESQIDAMHNDVVQLKSGGYIVLNATEALVAIDVNSGRATRERHIEHTAFRTNLEAAEEIARQLRLRDLAGLVVVDFIDMEESKHNREVERRLKEAMRQDRARIQIGRISPFGLLELSRQRLRPSLIESSTITCPHCSGSGVLRSEDSQALHVLRQIEEEGIRRGGGTLTITLPGNVLLLLMNRMRDRLKDVESTHGLALTFDSNPLVTPGTLEIQRQSNTRSEPERQEREPDDGEAAPTGRRDRRRRRKGDSDRAAETSAEESGVSVSEEETSEETGGESASGGRRGRRRRGKRGGRRRNQRSEDLQAAEAGEEESLPAEQEALTEAAEAQESAPPEAGQEPAAEDAQAAEGPEKPKGTRSRRRRRKSDATEESQERAAATQEGGLAEAAQLDDAETGEDRESEKQKAGAKPKRPRRRSSKPKAAESDVSEDTGSESEIVPRIPLASPAQEDAYAPPSADISAQPESKSENTAGNGERHPSTEEAGEQETARTQEEPVEIAANRESDSTQPKRRGWWSRPE